MRERRNIFYGDFAVTGDKRVNSLRHSALSVTTEKVTNPPGDKTAHMGSRCAGWNKNFKYKQS